MASNCYSTSELIMDSTRHSRFLPKSHITEFLGNDCFIRAPRCTFALLTRSVGPMSTQSRTILLQEKHILVKY